MQAYHNICVYLEILGVNGVMNCVFRVVAGALVDRFKFNQVMPVIASLLTIVLLSIFYIGKLSFIGLIICMWSIYGLSFVHFSTGPAQVYLSIVVLYEGRRGGTPPLFPEVLTKS